MSTSFKKEHSFSDRQAESSRIREKYPERVPVIAEKAAKSDIDDIDKKKYLVPSDLTVAQFTYVIRKRIKLPAEKSIFFFVGKQILKTDLQLSHVYKEYADLDGFLYITYAGENTFGAEQFPLEL